MDKTELKDEGSSSPLLPSCRYGSKCYRKNPAHFMEFSHPSKLDNVDNQNSQCESESPNPKRRKVDQKSYANCLKSGNKSTDIDRMGFLFTKVTGLSPEFNQSALGIKDLLSMDSSDCTGSVQFSYMVDFPWLIKKYPKIDKTCPLLIVLGEDRSRESTVGLQSDICEAGLQDCVKVCRARLEIPYGTHHTKMMIISYNNGLRIVIHTANLVEQDWELKTQGMYLSPLCPPMVSGCDGASSSNFKNDLIAYLRAYRLPPLNHWVELIEKHDLSCIKVHLVSSVPGRYTGASMNSFGHLRLKNILKNKMCRIPSSVLAQFSSIGSLGNTRDVWLKSEFLSSLSCCSAKPVLNSGCSLKLVYPSVDDVRCSLEGFMAGGSLPYSNATAKRQTYLKSLLNRWISDKHGRTRASPHIKSYAAVNKDSNLEWFLLTSANLSKAAWGSMEKKGTQFMIRSYELGVLWIPDDFNLKHFHKTLLPFDYPLTPYKDNDEPWVLDIPYKELPDSHGNMWCPGGR